jgi:hypothetical protein
LFFYSQQVDQEQIKKINFLTLLELALPPKPLIAYKEKPFTATKRKKEERGQESSMSVVAGLGGGGVKSVPKTAKKV